MEIEVRQVWACNLKREMRTIASLVRFFPFVAIDTEFPGFIMQSSRKATHEEIYATMKSNIDLLKLIQVGLSLFDEAGNLPSFGRPNWGCVWQFNLCDFDPATDHQSPPAIDLLKTSGIDFEAVRQSGINSSSLRSEFWAAGLIDNPRLQWVCFHGNYDFGYLLKLVNGGKPLPSTRCEFLWEISRCFHNVYDLKYMAKFYGGLRNGELGLRKLAAILEVERLFKKEEEQGSQNHRQYHQSGWDSLVTGLAFFLLKKHTGQGREWTKKKGTAEMARHFEWTTLLNYSQGLIFGMEDMRVPRRMVVPSWSLSCSGQLTFWNCNHGLRSSHRVALP